MSAISDTKQTLIDELDLFQDWSDRYEYIISLGKKLPSMSPEYRTEDNLIKGCQSQVWLEATKKGDKIKFHADSDSVITKGMIALFIRVFDMQSADSIITDDMSFINETGLKEHLAPTRANALHLMASRMKQKAIGINQ